MIAWLSWQHLCAHVFGDAMLVLSVIGCAMAFLGLGLVRGRKVGALAALEAYSENLSELQQQALERRGELDKLIRDFSVVEAQRKALERERDTWKAVARGWQRSYVQVFASRIGVAPDEIKKLRSATPVDPKARVAPGIAKPIVVTVPVSVDCDCGITFRIERCPACEEGL